MAIYRSVQLGFWTDNKVLDEFTPEDKYFYLYLFTNPQTNMCGCYEFSLKAMAYQTGYSKDTIERLLDRFKNIHKVIDYSMDTKEIFILNWSKYNWQGGKQMSCLENEISSVKSDLFRQKLIELFDEKFDSDTPYKGHGSPLQATVTVTDTVSDTVTDSITEIINYLNLTCNTNYKTTSRNTKKHISARLNEGFTVDDFKTVIDKKNTEWSGTDYQMYLRPETLFGAKFESYLNQTTVRRGSGESFMERLARA